MLIQEEREKSDCVHSLDTRIKTLPVLQVRDSRSLATVAQGDLQRRRHPRRTQPGHDLQR